MSDKDVLYIIIPAYNEKDNIKKCIDEWYKVIQKHDGNGRSRLVVINDGSRDETFSLMTDEAKERSLFVPLSKKNGGHGATVLFGYRYAISNSADFIFQTDSDGQTNPDEFEAFWNEREEYEAIIGERKVRGDGKSRKFVENVVCILLRAVFGVKVKDANAPFRLMKTELVNKYIEKLPKEYNIPNIMFTTYFVYYGHKVKFVPISFKPRQGGVNSIDFKKITKIGIKALSDFISFRKEMRR